MKRILAVGEIRFSVDTVNPWLSNAWVRNSRNHLSAATLSSLMDGELQYTAHGIAAAGFDVVSLAHPRLLQKGDTSLRKTAKALARRRVRFVGVGEGDEAYAPALLPNKGGDKVAFFGAASGPSRATPGLHIARAGDWRLHQSVVKAVAAGARHTYLLLHAHESDDVDFGRLLVDFDGIIVSGRKTQRLRTSLSSFVATPGTFHDATSQAMRVAHTVWIDSHGATQELVRQQVNPPLTRSTTIDALPKALKKVIIAAGTRDS